MNLFRKNLNQELELKLESYENQILELETQSQEQSEQIKSLINTVQSLSDAVEVKETLIEEKETVIVEKQEVIETQEVLIEKQDEIIQEVLDNTETVEKQAAVKALTILAEMGADVVEVLEGPEEIDLMAQLKKLKGQELTNFYNQNKSNIFKKLKD